VHYPLSSLGTRCSSALVSTDSPETVARLVDIFDNDFFNTHEHKVKVRAKAFDTLTRKNMMQTICKGDEKGWLMIYDLAWEVREDELRKICEEYGTVQEIRMKMRSLNKNMGYAMVKFEERDNAKRMMSAVRNN